MKKKDFFFKKNGVPQHEREILRASRHEEGRHRRVMREMSMVSIC